MYGLLVSECGTGAPKFEHVIRGTGAERSRGRRGPLEHVGRIAAGYSCRRRAPRFRFYKLTFPSVGNLPWQFLRNWRQDFAPDFRSRLHFPRAATSCFMYSNLCLFPKSTGHAEFYTAEGSAPYLCRGCREHTARLQRPRPLCSGIQARLSIRTACLQQTYFSGISSLILQLLVLSGAAKFCESMCL